MANRIISDGDLLSTALDLFRTYGFDGVSVKQLAEATGLEKASLYYRFPGGKDEIVMVATQGFGQWFQDNLFIPLKSSGSPRRRVQNAAERLRELYVGGTKACLTDVLSLPGGPPPPPTHCAQHSKAQWNPSSTRSQKSLVRVACLRRSHVRERRKPWFVSKVRWWSRASCEIRLPSSALSKLCRIC